MSVNEIAATAAATGTTSSTPGPALSYAGPATNPVTPSTTMASAKSTGTPPRSAAPGSARAAPAAGTAPHPPTAPQLRRCTATAAWAAAGADVRSTRSARSLSLAPVAFPAWPAPAPPRYLVRTGPGREPWPATTPANPGRPRLGRPARRTRTGSCPRWPRARPPAAGPGHRPELVHRLVYPEPAATPGAGRRVREQGVLGRGAHRRAEPLRAIQRQRRCECMGGADERHTEHGHGVPGDGPRPVVPAAGHQVPGCHPQPVPDEVASSSHQTDQSRGGAQRGQARADDAACPLVHHVGEQADQPELQHTPPRVSGPRPGTDTTTHGTLPSTGGNGAVTTVATQERPLQPNADANRVGCN